MKGWWLGFLFNVTFLIGGFSQSNSQISVSFKDLPLEIILDSISLKSGNDFSYNSEIIPPGNLYTYSNPSISVEALLKVLFVGTDLEYLKVGDQYVIKRIASKTTPQKRDNPHLEIQGWVREADSKKPMVGASVYINGSTIGAVTDEHGNYRMANIEPGNYILVFSHIGYETSSYALDGDESRHFTINALMDFNVEQLEDVEIVSERLINKTENARYFRTFQRELLGSSSNASNCEILNPEVLSYHYNDNWDFLDVQSSEPIVIQNMGLGYQTIFDLDYFTKDQNEVNFHGTARYQSLDTDAKNQRKRWKRNRLKAYNGSMIHFFKALINDELEEEGFTIALVEDIDQWNTSNRQPATRADILTRSGVNKEWVLKVENLLYVEYRKELESTQYLEAINQSDADFRTRLMVHASKAGQTPSAQHSLIELKSSQMLIGKDGKIKDLLNVITYGYWSWERLGDLMPIDYDPKSDNL